MDVFLQVKCFFKVYWIYFRLVKFFVKILKFQTFFYQSLKRNIVNFFTIQVFFWSCSNSMLKYCKISMNFVTCIKSATSYLFKNSENLIFKISVMLNKLNSKLQILIHERNKKFFVYISHHFQFNFYQYYFLFKYFIITLSKSVLDNLMAFCKKCFKHHFTHLKRVSTN